MEWNFVKSTLAAMGYTNHLVNLIFTRISIVSCQILINGMPSGPFIPHRGLMQGDPMSPYLFILCADVLSGMIHKSVEDKNLHGIKIARQAPQISHLFFVDNSLLFSRANMAESRNILNMLQTYQRASGQIVNLDKSEASFSQNVQSNDKDIICEMIGIKAVVAQSRYIGFPIPFRRSKKVIFSFFMERIWKKIMK